MNEIMKEGGCDYRLFIPQIVQCSETLEVYQIGNSSKNLGDITKERSGFQMILRAGKDSAIKRENFANSIAAFTIFSYIFGGVFHFNGNPVQMTLDHIYILPTGHVYQAEFKHILGFTYMQTELPGLSNRIGGKSIEPGIDIVDLFITSEMANELNIGAEADAFAERILKGFKILRRNYATLINIFQMVLLDMISNENGKNIAFLNQQLDLLYKRMMVDVGMGSPKAEENAEKFMKEKFIRLCKISGRNNLVPSYDEDRFEDG